MKLVELWMDRNNPDCLSYIVIRGRRSSNPRLCAHMLHRPMQEWIPAFTTRHRVWLGLIGELSGVLNSLHFTIRFVGVAAVYEEFRNMLNAQESSEIAVELEYFPQNGLAIGRQSPEVEPEISCFHSPQQPLDIHVAHCQIPEDIGSQVCPPELEADVWKADGISELVVDMQNLLENASDRYLKKRLRVIVRSLGSEDIHIYLNILYDTQDVAKQILHMGIPRLFLNTAQDETMDMPAVLGFGDDIAQAVIRVCQLHSLPFEDIMVLVVQSSKETFDEIVRRLNQNSPGVHTFRLSGNGKCNNEALYGMSVAYFSYLKKNLAKFIRSCPKDAWTDVTATEAVLRRLCRREENGKESNAC